MNRRSYSLDLFFSSFDVLRKNKTLMIFPILSGISLFGFIFFICGPEKISQNSHQFFSHGQYLSAFFYFFAFYFFSYFIMNFFNTALIACAMGRLNGQAPTLWDGLAAAFSKTALIAGWTIIESCVGVFLRLLETSRLTKAIFSMLGSVFTLVSMFVIPIMVAEDKDPLSALKESQTLLFRYFGGGRITRGYSFAFIFFFAWIPALLVLNFGFKHSLPPIGWATLCIYCGTLIILSHTCSAILESAIYLYLTGNLREGFNQEEMRLALQGGRASGTLGS